MKFQIVHEIEGRMRIRVLGGNISYEQADTLFYYLDRHECVKSVKVRERTQSVTVCYSGSRDVIIDLLKDFTYDSVEVPELFLKSSGRKMNAQYYEKLVNKILFRMSSRFFIPQPIRTGITFYKAVKYVCKGMKTLARGRIEVDVLDATAIGVSVLRNDYDTAGSIMFLLGIGEILDEWTHKKSVDDLARSLSLHVDNVWLIRDGKPVKVGSDVVRKEDSIVVYMGNMIPFDGEVVAGEAMVNQSSMTGEAVPVRKTEGGYVYAGTVVEEGELVIRVKEVSGAGKFDKIVNMIEESEKLKSELEGKAEHLADKLVPYSLAGTGLVYMMTRNATKALSVLMVDYSCALKLAMPIAVLSAIKEAGEYGITIKGGKYLEAVSKADTIVFDKTGTLTKAQPRVVDVISFNGQSEDELLRIAACIEEHFPHSMAKAVVDAAKERNLVHEEMHSKVEYVVAHGIYTTIQGKKVVIGSYHFVFEDEKCRIPADMVEKFRSIPEEYSQLYLAIENELVAVICIEDPLREESKEVLDCLRHEGISKIVMMTGDNRRTAKAIAIRAGVDEYYSEVLPEDKAAFIESEKTEGRYVIMVGDGVNDSPALSAANAGVAISDGAEIAREIADITISADHLYEMVTLKKISDALMRRIHKSYRRIVLINSSLILLGVVGIISPQTSAFLHNTSTLMIGLKNMERLLEEK